MSWVSLVQRLSSTSIYGRHREPFSWRNHCGTRIGSKKRIDDPAALRNISNRRGLCNNSSLLFQVHKKEIWRGPQDFFDVSITSSLSEEKYSGGENCYALLDCRNIISDCEFGNIESEMSLIFKI